MPIGVAVNGAGGRMGRMLVQAIAAESDLMLELALERSDSEFLGQDAGLVAGIGQVNVPLVSQVDKTTAEVIVDFSVPAATLSILEKTVAEGLAGMLRRRTATTLIFSVSTGVWKARSRTSRRICGPVTGAITTSAISICPLMAPNWHSRHSAETMRGARRFG